MVHSLPTHLHGTAVTEPTRYTEISATDYLFIPRKEQSNAHLHYSYLVISTVLLQHVSAFKGPSSGSTIDTLSQPVQQSVYKM